LYHRLLEFNFLLLFCTVDHGFHLIFSPEKCSSLPPPSPLNAVQTHDPCEVSSLFPFFLRSRSPSTLRLAFFFFRCRFLFPLDTDAVDLVSLSALIVPLVPFVIVSLLQLSFSPLAIDPSCEVAVSSFPQLFSVFYFGFRFDFPVTFSGASLFFFTMVAVFPPIFFAETPFCNFLSMVVTCFVNFPVIILYSLGLFLLFQPVR